MKPGGVSRLGAAPPFDRSRIGDTVQLTPGVGAGARDAENDNGRVVVIDHVIYVLHVSPCNPGLGS